MKQDTQTSRYEATRSSCGFCHVFALYRVGFLEEKEMGSAQAYVQYPADYARDHNISEVDSWNTNIYQ